MSGFWARFLGLSGRHIVLLVLDFFFVEANASVAASKCKDTSRSLKLLHTHTHTRAHRKIPLGFHSLSSAGTTK